MFFFYPINKDMGCNCGKDKIELSIRKRIRKEMKEKISEMKRIWEESKSQNDKGTVIINKKDLNFK